MVQAPLHPAAIALALACCALAPITPRVCAKIQLPTNQVVMVDRVVHIAPPASNVSRYAYVPFSVPPQTARIDVSYQYEQAGGANTIDLGLFDARSTASELDPRGFRGWSGGRRSDVFVSRAAATPGYLPGEMPAGIWRVILGLYRVVPAGVDVSLKIRIQLDTGRPPISMPPSNRKWPSAAGSAGLSVAGDARRPQHSAGPALRWWAGDLHMHTIHSDGDWTIKELVSSAIKEGLEFSCITDHNTASHHTEIDSLQQQQQLLVLRGEEITTYGGHANAWGLPSGTWIDFRVPPGDNARMSEIAAQVHRSGALISINHPFASCSGCDWSYDPSARDFDAIEVWNSSWDQTDEQALAMWDKILQSGRQITAIGSSDSHRSSNPLGQPTTHVSAVELSPRALLNAIRQGHVYLSSRVAQPVLDFEAEAANTGNRSRSRVGDQITLRAPGIVRFFIEVTPALPTAMISLISNGRVLKTLRLESARGSQAAEIDCRENSYFRLEVRDKTGAILGLTNPIYVRVGATGLGKR